MWLDERLVVVKFFNKHLMQPFLATLLINLVKLQNVFNIIIEITFHSL